MPIFEVDVVIGSLCRVQVVTRDADRARLWAETNRAEVERDGVVLDGFPHVRVVRVEEVPVRDLVLGPPVLPR